jgi:subtilisin-like proprotein convertase family protein
VRGVVAQRSFRALLPAFALALALVATAIGGSHPARAAAPLPVQVGDEKLLTRETPHPLPVLTAGEPVWRDVFREPGASYIAVHFASFRLGPGERVVVATPDGAAAYVFEGDGKPLAGGAFWATHVPGDTCVVTTYAGGGAAGEGYVVDRIAHGRASGIVSLPPPAPPSSDGFGSLSICGSDDSNWAKCYQTTEPAIYGQSRAIARLLVDGTRACTGWLVGCGGHLLTNHHCIATPADAVNTDYEFMAEGPTCATNCAGFGACPGAIEATFGTLVKTDAARDYSLVLLPVNLSSTYGFLRMRDGPAVVGERIAINGHPGGWGKRFAVASTDPSDPSGYCQIEGLAEPACETGGPSDVGYFCDTQDGSSGSPVVATSDGRVVALHHCADCPNRGVPIQSIVADLRATNDLPACAIQQLAGGVAWDAPSYSCAGTAILTVRDDSITSQPAQSVSVSSSAEPVPETVVLAASPPGSGIFVGSVALAAVPPVHGDGQVSVAHGGSIGVTYIDADDGSGGTNVPRTASATIDCVTPVITNVGATGVTGSGATLTWTTNEPATSESHYGPSSPPASNAESAALVTGHALVLSGLSECTNYLYDAVSRDAAGNTATDNRGGAFYAFTTPRNTNPVYMSASAPVPIPDNSPSGAVMGITVSDIHTVLDANVTVDITHPFDSDLILSLLPPQGPPILLANRRGGAGANFAHTVFDDEAAGPISAGTAPFAGSFRPESPLGAVDGIAASGVWTLKAVDAQGSDTGTIDGWSLTLTVPAGVCGPSIEYAGAVPADACQGSGASGGDGSLDPGEAATLPVTVRNNGTVPLTNVTATLASGTGGITITRGAAALPDIGVGAAQPTIAPHFAFAVDPAVACGSLIAFTLQVASSQGSWVRTFSVRIGAQTTSTAPYSSGDVPKTIPDEGTALSTLAVAGSQTIVDVDAGVTIAHSFDGDLTIDLIAPDGTPLALVNRRGGPGMNFTGTILDDEATSPIGSGTAPFTGRFRPEQPLSLLDGKAANGIWTLRVGDHGMGDSGSLDAWYLALTTLSGWMCGTCAPVPLESASLAWGTADKTSLNWSPAPYASQYALYRGARETLPGLLTSGQDSCTRAVTTGPGSGPILAETPAPGALYWYLAVGRNAAGEGSAGSATAGARIVTSTGNCP